MLMDGVEEYYARNIVVNSDPENITSVIRIIDRL